MAVMYKLHDGRWLNIDHIVEINELEHGDIEIILTHGDPIIIKEKLDKLCDGINYRLEKLISG